MRKTTKLIVLSLILVMLCSIAFVACNDEPDGNVEPGFYTLQEAYDNHLLTLDQLKNIAYHNNEPYVEKGITIDSDPNFVASPLNPSKLANTTQLKIEYAKTLAKDNSGEYVNPISNHIRLGNYLGTYGDVIAIYVYHYQDEFESEEKIEVVEGVSIYYPTTQRIMIYLAGKIEKVQTNGYDTFYSTVKKAYEENALTQQEVRSLAYTLFPEENDFGEDFVPDKVSEVVLDDEQKDSIIALDNRVYHIYIAYVINEKIVVFYTSEGTGLGEVVKTEIDGAVFLTSGLDEYGVWIKSN